MSVAEPFTCFAPTDAQLAFVRRLADERGYPMPAVYSKQHASLLIDEIRSGAYYPPEWVDDEDVPWADDEDVPF